jgi:hypothetical protein
MEKDLPAIGGPNEPEAALCDNLLNGALDHVVSFRLGEIAHRMKAF